VRSDERSQVEIQHRTIETRVLLPRPRLLDFLVTAHKSLLAPQDLQVQRTRLRLDPQDSHPSTPGPHIFE